MSNHSFVFSIIAPEALVNSKCQLSFHAVADKYLSIKNPRNRFGFRGEGLLEQRLDLLTVNLQEEVYGGSGTGHFRDGISQPDHIHISAEAQ